MMRLNLTIALVAIAYLVAPIDSASGTLINKYANDPGTWVNGGRPQGGGSANITATSSSEPMPSYGVQNTVSGNFSSDGSHGQGFVGGELQPSGFYGVTTDPDPDTMWFSADSGFGSPPINEQWLSYSFSDGPHSFGEMRLWNQNEITPPTGSIETTRGTKDFYVWYSNDATIPTITGGPRDANPGAGWTLDGDVRTLAQGPADPTYDGEAIDLGDFTANHVLLMIDSNHGGAWAGLMQAQFFVPEPSSVVMLTAGLLGLMVRWRRRG